MALKRVTDVYDQVAETWCGAAAAINVLRVFGLVYIGGQDHFTRETEEVFRETRTTRFTEWLGSTPEGVIKYIKGLLRAAHTPFTVYKADDLVPGYKSINGLLNLALNASATLAIADRGRYTVKRNFTSNDVILRFLDVRHTVYGHFITQTNFDNRCQFLDSGAPEESRYKNMHSFAEWLADSDDETDNTSMHYRCTNINVGFHDDR